MNYVRVQTGDVIGVSLPTQNALPIVSSGANGYSLKTETAINAPSVLRSNTLNTASSLALHLNPTIGEDTNYNVTAYRTLFKFCFYQYMQ